MFFFYSHASSYYTQSSKIELLYIYLLPCLNREPTVQEFLVETKGLKYYSQPAFGRLRPKIINGGRWIYVPMNCVSLFSKTGAGIEAYTFQ